MEKEYNNVDRQIKWEKFMNEHGEPTWEGGNRIFRELEEAMRNEKDDHRKRILDMIYWLTDKVKSLQDTKKVYDKYKDEKDPNKSFEYIYKKLPNMLHYHKDALGAIEKVNKMAMEMYGKILDMALEDREGILKEMYEELREYDEDNRIKNKLS